jgi:hypothetical protein
MRPEEPDIGRELVKSEAAFAEVMVTGDRRIAKENIQTVDESLNLKWFSVCQ